MIPDALPILTHGLGDITKGKACAMSAVSWLEGGSGQTDAPQCVHPVLRMAFIYGNDWRGWTDDDHRTRTLWPLIARGMGTRPAADEHAQHTLAVRLAIRAARFVLPLVLPEHRDTANSAIRAAEDWCRGAASADECLRAASASTYAAARAAYAAANAAYAAVHARNAVTAVDAAAVASVNPASLLESLLDEYERLTRHVPQPVDLSRFEGHVPVLVP